MNGYWDVFLSIWPWNLLFGKGKKGQAVSYLDKFRSRMTILFGAIGSGKSKLIVAIAMFDAIRRVTGLSNRGFAVLDLTEDLFEDLINRLALLALKHPQLNDLIYIVDLTDEEKSPKYNPLDLSNLRQGETPEARAESLADAITYVYDDDSKRVVRLHRILSNAFLALMLSGASVTSLPDFLRKSDYRKEVLSTIYHPMLNYWTDEFPTHHKSAMDLIESSMNRVERLIRHPDIAFFLEGESTLDFRQIMDDGGIILINAPRRLYKDGASLFLSLLVAEFQSVANSRTDISKDKRTPFTLFCDEFQEYLTDSMRQIIQTSRKLRLDVFLATQEIQGLSKHRDLREVIRKLAGNILVMRLSRFDAELIVDSLFSPNIDQIKTFVDGKPLYRNLNEIREKEIRKITSCPDQRVYFKQQTHDAEYLRTPTISDIDERHTEDLLLARKALDLASFQKVGVRKLKRLQPPKGSRSKYQYYAPEIDSFSPKWAY